MVAALLTALALGVIQLALAMHVKNTLTDAAAEGARYAALADSSLSAGVERTRLLISTALSDGFAGDVSARTATLDGQAVVEVSASAPLPIVGLFGVAGGLDVRGHAPLESISDDE